LTNYCKNIDGTLGELLGFIEKNIKILANNNNNNENNNNNITDENINIRNNKIS
jgi:hypothetical protein